MDENTTENIVTVGRRRLSGFKNTNKIFRQAIKIVLTGSKGLILQSSPPNLDKINAEKLGIYLHIPFCRSLCLYCPYFKEKYDRTNALLYKDSVIKELTFYKSLLENKKITSFYIGGGTPTTMLGSGLEEIIYAIQNNFDVTCGISIETHPNDVTSANVERLKNIGVRNVSMGIESFNDHFLQILGRPYRNNRAKEAIKILMSGGFGCINIDLMFGLPNQKIEDVQKDIETALDLGVDQISTYPIFTFPHTKLRQIVKENKYYFPGIFERRKMLKEIEKLCYNAGMERTSVWAFTRTGVEKYSSVTIPNYVGIGAGAGSLAPGFFYINVFDVQEYVKYLTKNQAPSIALTINFSEMDEMMHWLYWRIYETKIDKKEFKIRFNKDFDNIFGKIFSLFELIGLAHDYGDKIVMTDKGNYWVHVLQNLFSLDFIGRVWSICLSEKWPKEIELI